MKAIPLVLTAFCLTLVTACVNLKPKSAPMQLYALGPIMQAAPQQAGPHAMQVYVARPSLPAYLDSKQLLFRSNNGEVKHVATARWAEPLDDGIARATSEYLGLVATSVSKAYYPLKKPAGTAALKIQIQQFNGTEGGQVQFQADWQLENAEGKLLKRGSYLADSLSWAPGDASSLVAGLNTALSEMATAIHRDI